MRLSIGLAVLLVPALALGQVPGKLAYQGRLLNADGTPVQGTESMQFAIYDAASGGSQLWTETQAVPVDNGFYSVVLGDVTALPSTVFTGTERYLELTVGTSTLSPRQRIDSVAYALLSQGLAGATSCSSGQVPKWTGSGWTCGDDNDANSGGTVTSVSGAGPISVANSTTTPAVSISQASASSDGYLSSTDWRAFNSKQAAIQSTCTVGQYIQGINVDGSVVCGDDVSTGYTAGAGLALTGTSFSLLPGCGSTQIPKWDGTTWACGDDQGITTVKTDGTTVTGDGVTTALSAAAVTPAYTSSLPANPTDGEEIYYSADAANGVVWHLRYNASESTYHWEFLGGSPILATVAGSSSTTSTTLVTLGGPSITVPLSGDYMVRMSVQGNSAQTNCPKAQAAIVYNGSVVGTTAQGSTCSARDTLGDELKVTMAAGNVVRIEYDATASDQSVSFSARRLTIVPIRVN